MPELADSTPDHPAPPASPFATAGMNVVFGVGDAWSTVDIARLDDEDDIALTATASHASGVAQLTLQGDRSAVERAVTDLVRALAGLDAETEGGARS